MSTSVDDIPKLKHKPLLDSVANFRRTISHARYAGLVGLSMTSFILPMTPIFGRTLSESNMGQGILMAGLIGFLLSVVFWSFDCRLNILQSIQLKELHKMAKGNEQISQALKQWVSEGRTPLWKDFEIVRQFQEESIRRNILSDMAGADKIAVFLKAMDQRDRMSNGRGYKKLSHSRTKRNRIAPD